MSVPTHNLYEFVHQVLENRYIIKYFYPWGSRDLSNLIDLYPTSTKEQMDWLSDEFQDRKDIDNIFPPNVSCFFNWIIFQNVLLCHDQEPLRFNYYENVYNDETLRKKWNVLNRSYFKTANLKASAPTNYKQHWILLHSEINSVELEKYEKSNQFIGAYWWSHAVISRDWYRYAEHDTRLNQKKFKKLFLTYCRDTSGSREYRQQFLNLLSDKNLSQSCNFGNRSDSDSSALYDWQDITTTGIHIVLETVFDHRIHLTEKTLRPIACKQPFIIANGPGTLEYLKSYGFKTYSPWINESYDLEQDDNVRLEMIVDEMQRLSELSAIELEKVLSECNKIAEYNYELFFSDNFFDQLINELKTNVKTAIEKSKNQLSWKTMWEVYKQRKFDGGHNNPLWIKRRPYILNLIKHLKKGGNIEDYVPPDLD